MTKKLLKLAAVCCLTIISVFTLTAQDTRNTTRKRYPVGSELRQTEDTRCFAVTKAEADRAFAGKYWEDAGKLYRAAKLCSDATQSDRAWLTSKIEACSKAAEAELQSERDKAIKQARQAIASNRANDARDLLARNDRTTAYRLAKFANDYIAPAGEDNPDCLQAIYNVWQQKTPEADGNIQVIMPFCYELMYTNDDSVTVRFQKSNDKLKLFAFSPKKHRLYEWTAPEFTMTNTIVIDSTMRYFDLSPDGQTMVFRSGNAFQLIRNGKKHIIGNQITTNLYCFSSDSRQFFYIDRQQLTGVYVNLDDVFNASKEKRSQKGLGYYVPAQNFVIDHIPVAMAYGNNCIWLISPTKIVFYRMSIEKGARNNWSIFSETPLAFPENPNSYDNNYEMFADPQKGLVYRYSQISFSTSKIAFQNNSFSSVPDDYHPGRLMSSDKTWLESENYNSYQLMLQRDDTPGPIRSIQFDEYSSFSSPQSGSVSWTGTNSGWLALSDLSGTLRLWQISADFSERSQPIFAQAGAISCSADGLCLSNCVPGQPVEYYNQKHQIERLGTFPAVTSEFFYAAVECSNNGWVAFAPNPDTVILMGKGKSWYLNCAAFGESVFRFDNSGKYFATVVEGDSLSVFRLDSNEPQLVAGRRFDAMIGAVAFIPNSTSVIVQRKVMEGGSSRSVSIPKIWDFRTPAGQLVSVRMEQYWSQIISTDPTGKFLFFSDGKSVKIFKRDSLSEEINSLGTRKAVFIQSISVHPEAPVVAVGYSDGMIGFYNYLTGRNMYHFRAVIGNGPKDMIYNIRLAFTPKGQQLIAIFNQQHMQFFDLDIKQIQEKISISGGQLISFAPAQIGHWELDKALKYGNNFEKLARSGDLPLIRSFFTFYSEEATSSNRLDDVDNYCKRASYLFDLLDEESKKVQRFTLLSMYDNYLWKLLQRNQVDAADKVIRNLIATNRFKGLITTMPAQAHIALLRHDLKTAAKLYAEWISEDFTLLNEGIIGLNIYDELERIEQLAQYGYISGDQIALACAIFDKNFTFSEKFCQEDGFSQDELERIFNDPVTWLLFRINLLLRESEFHYGQNFALLKKPLTEALQLSRQLQKSRKKEGIALEEKAAIRLADVLKNEGKFEADGLPSVRAINILTEGIALLENKRFINGKNEIYRLDTLAALYLARGNARFATAPDQAFADFYQSSTLLYQLDSLYTARAGTPSYNYRYQFYYANLMVAKCLLQKNKIEEAGAVLGDIQEPFFSMPVFATGMAYHELLSGSREGAFINLSTVTTDTKLAEVLAEVEIFAAQRKNDPAEQKRLTDFNNDLMSAVLQLHPEIDSLAVLLWKEHLLAYNAIASGDYNAEWEISRKAVEKYKFLADTSKNASQYPVSLLLPYSYLVLHQTNSVLFLKNVSRAQLTEALDIIQKTLIINQKRYAASNLLYLNTGHILMMLGQQEKAVLMYETFDARGSYKDYSYFDMLLKDFRNLYNAGVRLPGLPAVIKKIFPEDYPFTKEELKMMSDE